MFPWAAIIQVVLGVFGPLALFLSLNKRRSGLWLGLATQIFWFWLAISSGLWGVFVTTCAYTGVFIYQLAKKTC